METLFALTVAVAVLKPHPAPTVEPPKVVVACPDGSHRAADRCVRDKAQARSKSTWQIGY